MTTATDEQEREYKKKCWWYRGRKERIC